MTPEPLTRGIVLVEVIVINPTVHVLVRVRGAVVMRVRVLVVVYVTGIVGFVCVKGAVGMNVRKRIVRHHSFASWARASSA